MRQLTLDLSQASLTQDSNPFFSNPSSPSSSTSVSPFPTSFPGTSNGGAQEVSTSFAKIASYQKAHGILMGLVVVILFPLGAIVVRLVGSPWGHGAWQVVSLITMIAGLGVGVKLAQMTDLVCPRFTFSI